MLRSPCLALVLAGAPATPAHAQTLPQPATEQPRERPTEAPHERSWEAPETYVVEGTAPLREEQRIGEYAQPRWTAARRFPLTRIYVAPAGSVQFEWWLETKLDLGNTDNVRFRPSYEWEFGLGHRLQLDLYLVTQQEGWQAPTTLYQETVELRYALAKWGALPGNPTLYGEWVRQDGGPEKGEFKLLLGDELSPRWHWGVNAVIERQLGAHNAHEYAATAGLAYTAIDSALSIGVEAKGEAVDERGCRLSFASCDRAGSTSSYEAMAGPSVQWRPVPAMHVDLVVPFGFETEKVADATGMGAKKTTKIVEPVVIVGWEF